MVIDMTEEEFQKWQDKFYRSKTWIRLRDYCKTRDYGICQRCGKATGLTIEHHKIWITPDNCNDSMIVLNADNIETLCIDCHNQEHMKKNNQTVSFDSDGNPIPLQTDTNRSNRFRHSNHKE